MLVSGHRTLARRSREGFTLLEVLVVVAIIVILAGVAGVAMFRYIEDARVDTARTQMTNFENAAKNYMAKNEGVPPQTLNDLVAPQDGSKPLLEGGIAVLTPPVPNTQYDYDPNNVDSFGSPDPLVSLKLPDGRVVYSTRRPRGPQQ